VLPGAAGQPFSMMGMTYLDILQYFGQNNAETTLFNNEANQADIKQFAQRMQAHRGDPSYFQTAQGKADLQKMQAMQQQLGNTTVHNSGQGSLMHAANTTNPAGTSGSSPNTKMMPGMARIRVQDTFDIKSTQAFSGSTSGSVGPIQASIEVKVEKLK
jgi:hypothetical protein